MKYILATTLSLIAVPALSSDAPSFDCKKASSSAETLVCADPKLSALDARLAQRFAAANAAAQSLQAGSKQAEDTLRASQRGWIKSRDECWKANDLANCVSFAYLSREAELVALWVLEDPSAVVAWTCDGNPANEVVTQFFDTELPSVRFERGDSIDAGSLSRTASGARYDGSFGRFIWIKGDEALYRDPDPDGTETSCVRSN